MRRGKTELKKYLPGAACIAAGVLFYMAAEFMESGKQKMDSGILWRNEVGQGDLIYEFYVEGLEEEPQLISVTVPERVLTDEEFDRIIPEASEILCERILGDNLSLREVRTDLSLTEELPEYGLKVSWESEKPELLSGMGILTSGELPKGGEEVILKATLFRGLRIVSSDV